MQSRGKLAANLRQYVLERRGKLRGKIAANSQRGKLAAKFFFCTTNFATNLPPNFAANLLRRGKLAANFCGKCAVNLPHKRKKLKLAAKSRGKFAANFAAQKKKICHKFAASRQTRGKISR
jgi:hypothetical protein